MSMWQVLFLSASEEINKRPDKYWTLVMDIARRNNLKRIVRCSQIMGRAESDDLSAAQIFYPCMQCADIFFLEVRLWRPFYFILGNSYLSGVKQHPGSAFHSGLRFIGVLLMPMAPRQAACRQLMICLHPWLLGHFPCCRCDCVPS